MTESVAVSTMFQDPGEISDGEIALVLASFSVADPKRGLVPAYQLEIRERGLPVGRINLRLGASSFLTRFAGQVGYEVDEPHRGRRIAARALVLLKDLARRHGFDELWATMNPENVASRRTCELAGATFIETVDLPPETEMYRKGDRQKCRYRICL